ncbi:MAG: hypothetical protein M1838_002858 [Thelocarpon superellum]|nr:MAG: hypothetical protein M1838_002858 [Thelocarpon superellum]
MPRILVLGATGYVGNAVALALIRANHEVYGLARSSQKAQSLSKQEIIPVEGSHDSSAAYVALIESERIDVVIDTTGANDGSTQILADVIAAGRARLAAQEKAGRYPHKLAFIYTSGMWVHGSSAERVSDLDVVGAEFGAKTPGADITAWRPALEQKILQARDVLNAVVVRPGIVYGASSSIFTMFLAPLFDAAKSEAPEVGIPVDPAAVTSLVHVEDLATAYTALVDKIELFSSPPFPTPFHSSSSPYPVFDFCTSVESLAGIFLAAAKELGYTGKVEFTSREGNVFAQAFSGVLIGDSTRAKTLLGWHPQKTLGMLAGMRVYAHAWAAGYSS